VRWAFPDPSEEGVRADLERRIDAWWDAVKTAASRLRAWSSDAALDAALASIDPGLEWELAPGRAHRLRCVVSCGHQRSLQPLVDRIIARAPADLGLETSGERPAESVDAAAAAIRRQFGVDCSSWSLEFKEPEHGLLPLAWRGPSPSELDAAVSLSKRLLGERAVMDWVGSVEIAPPSLRATLFRRGDALDSIVGAFSRERERVLARRPDRPLQIHSSRGREASWSIASLSPGRRDGFLPELTSLRAADLELVAAMLSGAPFSSCRFTRFNEIFAYLHSETSPDDVLRLNVKLEHALDEALRADGLGRTIAAGTAERASSVLVVLGNLPRAIERIRLTLTAHEVPPRTWLRFADNALAFEWVGFTPGGPPPP
jgi:hypothetical protein